MIDYQCCISLSEMHIATDFGKLKGMGINVRVFQTDLDVNCEICDPILVKPHWWSAKHEEKPVKAEVGVRVPSCNKTKRDYIYLCADCFSSFGYKEIEYLIGSLNHHDEFYQFD